MSDQRHGGSQVYWILAIALSLLGFVGIFSFGLPLLVIGIALIVLGPLRGRRSFWPLFVGTIFMVATYLLIAPLGCSTSVTVPVGRFGEGRTQERPAVVTCGRVLLPATRGAAPPPLWPYVLAAAGMGFVSGAIVRQVQMRGRAGAR